MYSLEPWKQQKPFATCGAECGDYPLCICYVQNCCDPWCDYLCLPCNALKCMCSLLSCQNCNCCKKAKGPKIQCCCQGCFKQNCSCCDCDLLGRCCGPCDVVFCKPFCSSCRGPCYEVCCKGLDIDMNCCEACCGPCTACAIILNMMCPQCCPHPHACFQVVGWEPCSQVHITCTFCPVCCPLWLCSLNTEMITDTPSRFIVKSDKMSNHSDFTKKTKKEKRATAGGSPETCVIDRDT